MTQAGIEPKIFLSRGGRIDHKAGDIEAFRAMNGMRAQTRPQLIISFENVRTWIGTYINSELKIPSLDNSLTVTPDYDSDIKAD